MLNVLLQYFPVVIDLARVKKHDMGEKTKVTLAPKATHVCVFN